MTGVQTCALPISRNLPLFDRLPSAFGQGRPADAVHIEPITERLIFFRVRAKAQHVTIWIFDLHLQSPRIICGRIANLRARRLIFLMQSLDVLTVDPYPASGMSLVSFTEKQPAPATRD